MKRIALSIGIAAALSAGFAAFFPEKAVLISAPDKILKSVGDPVDSLDGVVVYYNGSVANTCGRNLSPDGYNLGLKYQCVEFVKRYYFEHYLHRMPDSYGHAKDFFHLGLKDGSMNPHRNLRQFCQGSSSRPEKGDLIVFDGNAFNPYGHVAIVSEASNEAMEIIQQNPGPMAPSREVLSLEIADGKWLVGRSDVLGWLRK